MPKKRHHFTKYSKPPSTPPPLLSSTAAGRNGTQHKPRGVNELLADLRRAGLSSRASSGSGSQSPDVTVNPTVPPSLRPFLQIPETPPPRPRRPVWVDPVTGLRLPPGPAPPRSWLSGNPPGAARERTGAGQRTAVESDDGEGGHTKAYKHRRLPGVRLPEGGSLMDMALRRLVLDWEWQRTYCQYHLYELPTHLRVALISYLVTYAPEGVSLRDLQAVLLPPPDVPEYADDPDLAPSVVNESFRHLDLSGSLGRSLKLRELTDLLFPPQRDPADAHLQESWDAPDPAADDTLLVRSRPLLPNLTHLSLALSPQPVSGTHHHHHHHQQQQQQQPRVSWRHLLALASHLPQLTHLSLAHWPEPTLTPNARLAAVVDPRTGRAIPYGGTGFYSHSLDGDWAEAVLLLRRLSRCLYGLEWLELTGCGAWFPALWGRAGGVGGEEGDGDGDGNGDGDGDGVMVDWRGAWGKIDTLVLFPGYELEEGAGVADTATYWEIVDWARRVERHVRAQRAGKGRFITVETCKRPGEL
ncbi:hypothetical protein VTK26DRAFT_2162 [Humicola hyalothermophila]